MRKMTFDIKEIYHAALERKCKLRVYGKYYEYDTNARAYHIEIMEQDGTVYFVSLFADHENPPTR